ncbi:MAG: hypothetical protein LBD11_00265 [Candidatus Peribacteria bacterium]|jgi:hypothetical protein|nr:hypothetical protein [Candidatus Peribacteria bacterium]
MEKQLDVKLNEKFDRKELWEVVKKEFPEFIVTENIENAFAGYLPRKSLPTMRLEILFQYEEKGNAPTFYKLGSWVKVKIDASPIGKYQSIYSVMEKFISYLQLMNNLEVISNKDGHETGVIYSKLLSEKDVLPSLKGCFLNDWDSALKVMRSWKDSEDSI